MENNKAAFIPSAPETEHDYVVYKNVRIPMRDGTELFANIFFPSKNGVVDFEKKYPVLMNRSAYLVFTGEYGTYPCYMPYFATEQGYVFVINASRGTYLSEGGAVQPMMDEGWGEHQDGADTVKWIISQPWSNGKVATCGFSWLGGTQYELQLAGDVPGLVTSSIQCPAMNSYKGGWFFKDEFLDMGCCPQWALAMMIDQCGYKHLPEDVIDAIMKENEILGDPLHNPKALAAINYPALEAEYGVINMPLFRHIPFFVKALKNRENEEYFDYNNTSKRKHDKAPVLFIASWNDLFNDNALNGYMQMVKDAPDQETAQGHRLVVSPWPHAANLLLRQFPEADTDMRLMVMEWTQQQVNGIESKFFKENPVTIFVQGENRWRSEQSWPLKDVQLVRYYLHSGGKANTLRGDGVLSLAVPSGQEEADRYVYDPADPIMIAGGQSRVGGHADQRPAEARGDVLVYTSEVLQEDMEITGYVRAELYAATSAEDTDFFMKLVDVCPDGIAYNILTGGRRGRYIKNGRSNPEALVPGEINKYEINLHPTSYVFKKGHRIRVDICSSDALNYDINPNAFVDLNTATKKDYVTADQTIYHDKDHPSMIELPLIPASHERNWIDLWPFRASLTGINTENEQRVRVGGVTEPKVLEAEELPRK